MSITVVASLHDVGSIMFAHSLASHAEKSIECEGLLKYVRSFCKNPLIVKRRGQFIQELLNNVGRSLSFRP